MPIYSGLPDRALPEVSDQNLTNTVAPRGVTDPYEMPDLPERLMRLPLVSSDLVESPSLSSDLVEAEKQDFHRGETASTLMIGRDVGPAIEAAGRVAENLHGSNECIIRAGEVAAVARDRFTADPVMYDAFIAALVIANVLTRRDGQLKDASPKLSKLLTVGQHADLLRRPDIFPRLPYGYTALYETILLLKELPGNETEQTKALSKILAEGERDQVLSRQFVADQRKLAKRRRPERSKEPVKERDNRADLIVATPSQRDIRKLEQHVTEDSLPACRRLNELASDAANLVLVVPLWAMSVAKSTMIDESGFALQRVLLLSCPDGPDVTDIEVALIAARGPGDREMPNIEWPEDARVMDPKELADRLFANAANKVWVFGDKAEGAWDALVGDENWSVKP